MGVVVDLLGENTSCLLTFVVNNPLLVLIGVPSNPFLLIEEGVEKLDFGFNVEFEGVKNRLCTVPGVL